MYFEMQKECAAQVTLNRTPEPRCVRGSLGPDLSEVGTIGIGESVTPSPFRQCR